MKNIPPLTDEEWATACKCVDMTLRATGLQFLQVIAALDRKLGAAVDVPPTEEKPNDTE